MKILEVCAAVAVLTGSAVACLVGLSREKHEKSKDSDPAETPTPTPTSMKTPEPSPFADIKRPEVSEEEFFEGLHVREVDRG